MWEYRKLKEAQICRELFGHFERRQEVNRVLRRQDGEWVVREEPFIDQWSEEDYGTLVGCLKNTIRTGGYVCGAFEEGVLKGFVSVESDFFGSEGQYLDLTSLHVSADRRKKGKGRILFLLAAGWAKERGAKKLYISSHSAVETQAFYCRLGCLDAEETKREHVEAEPCDRQLEYVL